MHLFNPLLEQQESENIIWWHLSGTNGGWGRFVQHRMIYLPLLLVITQKWHVSPVTAAEHSLLIAKKHITKGTVQQRKVSFDEVPVSSTHFCSETLWKSLWSTLVCIFIPLHLLTTTTNSIPKQNSASNEGKVLPQSPKKRAFESFSRITTNTSTVNKN